MPVIELSQRRREGQEMKKDKDLKELQQARPFWLSLFHDDAARPFISTFDLDSQVPKFVYGKPVRDAEGRLSSIERVFSWKAPGERDFKLSSLTLHPARIKEGSKFIEYFPGLKEELVIDACIKLAQDGAGVFLDDQYGLIFSVRDIRQELAKHGHIFSHNEVMKSLMILRRSSAVIQDMDGKIILDENFIKSMSEPGRGRSKSVYIQFNSLISDALKRGEFRLTQYKILMEYETILARKIHKYISVQCCNMSEEVPCKFEIKKFLDNLGFATKGRLSYCRKIVEKALVEMKERGIVSHYAITKLDDDYLVHIYPSPEFAAEMIRTNTRRKAIAYKLTGDISR